MATMRFDTEELQILRDALEEWLGVVLDNDQDTGPVHRLSARVQENLTRQRIRESPATVRRRPGASRDNT